MRRENPPPAGPLPRGWDASERRRYFEWDDVIDGLCSVHPEYHLDSPQWAYLCEAFPIYHTLSKFTADLRLRQIAVHTAIAEKVWGPFPLNSVGFLSFFYYFAFPRSHCRQ